MTRSPAGLQHNAARGGRHSTERVTAVTEDPLEWAYKPGMPNPVGTGDGKLTGLKAVQRALQTELEMAELLQAVA
jgi:hypothetical protein